MIFEKCYKKHKHMIPYLLKKYNIKYNKDELSQLLLIRMWELFCAYNPTKSMTMSTFLYRRLNFYLIDLLRKIPQAQHLTLEEHEHQAYFNFQAFEDQLIHQNFYALLTPNEKQWLTLKIEGYKQNEIADILHCSLSTIKNHQKRVRSKFNAYYHNY
ncbi:hypothetical protein AST12_06390 [Staphylococcus succinus]|nr:hypothetical protein AST12_06390 [Staphylococcus succinus]